MKTSITLPGFTAVLATSVLLTVALADQPSAVSAPTQPSAPRNGEEWRASSADASRAASTPQRDLALLPAQAAPVAPTSEVQLERGRYLVFRTGLCTDCHSPRNEKGEHIESQHLMGAPIPFAPTVPMPWMPAAPRLAGLPAGFNEEQMVRFLMTGERPNGRGQPLPPMPPYRFDRADASAIVAYLRSLPAK